MRNRIITQHRHLRCHRRPGRLGSGRSCVPLRHRSWAPTSLAKVLAADGHKFDQKWGDFDILDARRDRRAHREAEQPCRRSSLQGKKPL